MKTCLILFSTLFWISASAQPPKKESVVIGSMISKPNAILIVNPQNSDQGVLLPQLSTGQRASLKPNSPHEDGLIVFDKGDQSFYYWSQGAWTKIRAHAGSSRYYSLDPASFQELKPDFNIRHTNMVVFESDNSFVTASRNGAGEELIAPLNLPHEAVLQEVTIYYMDNDNDNIRVHLQRKGFATAPETILTWQSSGSSPAINNVTLSNFTGRERIDLQNYTYRIVVVFDIDDGEEVDLPAAARQRLYGIRIKYQE